MEAPFTLRPMHQLNSPLVFISFLLGYRNCFPFFDEHHPELSCAGKNPRTNFKQVSYTINSHYSSFSEIGVTNISSDSRRSVPLLKVCSLISLLSLIQIFAIEHPGEIAFFGFARPAFGSIPPLVEMQARYYSLIINGVSQATNHDD